ncbi:fas apoptotic inhibitory molecule 1-like isoform 1-T1 [Dama dama]
MTDLVALWKVALSDRVHKIEFEHGTASGKRVVYVNGKKVLRKEWMFSLIGKETFCIGASKIKATINIKPRCASSYDYTLEINGKSLKEYMESRKKTTNTWILHLNSKDFRVVLEKDTMDVWCNGKKMKTVSSPRSPQQSVGSRELWRQDERGVPVAGTGSQCCEAKNSREKLRRMRLLLLWMPPISRGGGVREAQSSELQYPECSARIWRGAVKCFKVK